MRALHVIPVIAPRYGGPSQAIVGMCRALGRSGAQVLVASTDGDGPGRLPVPLETPVSHAGVPTIFFRRQWSDSLHYSQPMARWVDAHVREFDVVHIHAIFSHVGPAVARSCLRQSVPYVVRPVGHLDPWSLHQHRFRKRVLWHLWAKRMLDGASAVHYTTVQEQRLAEAGIGRTRGVVIPLGVDDDLLTNTAAPQRLPDLVPGLGESPYVLSMSRMHPKKQLDLLVEVFLDATADEALTNWRLVLAGDGPPEYVASLRRLVAQRNAEQRVLFPGWIGGEDRAPLLRGAGLMALPSAQENFGLAVVEALACGVPVLVSQGVNLADEIGAARAGWVAPLDRRALALELGAALSNAEERQQRGRNGYELARTRFTWPAIAEQLLELYASIRQ